MLPMNTLICQHFHRLRKDFTYIFKCFRGKFIKKNYFCNAKVILLNRLKGSLQIS